ncbi:hypothetical protein [Clostridioides difficile]|uniref:hypothetical protein n=1 Tax=Clostridioides difficile TaxID=1496 RepID=UPI0031B6127A
MFKYENAVSGKTNIDRVWALYDDVSKWSLWDKSVKSVQLMGEFKVGSTGVMEMANGSKLPFSITECEEKKYFTTESSLGPIVVTFGHILEEKNDIVTIVHTVQINGGDEIQMKGMGKGITENIPDCMKQLLSISMGNEIF